MSWMHGETVTVYFRSGSGEDEYGDPVETVTSQTVDNVLVMPVAGDDLNDPVRPDGVRVSYRLAFPKDYTRTLAPGALRGSSVALTGRGMVQRDAMRVSGEPDRFKPCPTDWDMLVYVGRTDG